MKLQNLLPPSNLFCFTERQEKRQQRMCTRLPPPRLPTCLHLGSVTANELSASNEGCSLCLGACKDLIPIMLLLFPDNQPPAQLPRILCSRYPRHCAVSSHTESGMNCVTHGILQKAWVWLQVRGHKRQRTSSSLDSSLWEKLQHTMGTLRQPHEQTLSSPTSGEASLPATWVKLGYGAFRLNHLLPSDDRIHSQHLTVTSENPYPRRSRILHPQKLWERINVSCSWPTTFWDCLLHSNRYLIYCDWNASAAPHFFQRKSQRPPDGSQGPAHLVHSLLPLQLHVYPFPFHHPSSIHSDLFATSQITPQGPCTIPSPSPLSGPYSNAFLSVRPSLTILPKLQLPY